MDLDEKDLKRLETPIKGFGQVKILVVGNITLPLILREGNYTTIKRVTFTVVRFTSTYNGILGRPSLHEFGIVTSSFHQCIKFQTSIGICCIRGLQQTTKTYNVSAIQCPDNVVLARNRRALEVLQNSIPNYLRTTEKIEPSNEFEIIKINDNKEFKIGKNLEEKERK